MQKSPDVPLNWPLYPALLRDPEAFPGELGDMVPQVVFPSIWRARKPHQGRHPDQTPHHLTWTYSEPLVDDWASHSVSKGEPRHPVEEARFRLLASVTSFLRSLPTALGHRWGLEHRATSKWQRSLSAPLSLYHDRLTHGCSDQSVSNICRVKKHEERVQELLNLCTFHIKHAGNHSNSAPD